MVVTNRLATLRSWLDGEGVTVQGKKHHTVTTTVEPKNLLEKKTSCHQPRFIEAYVVDGYFFLHLMKDLPTMWSRAAREILLRLCRFPARRIDLVFDLVSSPSIKDCERDRRSNEERSAPFRIFGPNQHRPQDFIKSLRNDNFKREIVRFLVESWSDDSLASILGDKVVHITHKGG